MSSRLPSLLLATGSSVVGCLRMSIYPQSSEGINIKNCHAVLLRAGLRYYFLHFHYFHPPSNIVYEVIIHVIPACAAFFRACHLNCSVSGGALTATSRRRRRCPIFSSGRSLGPVTIDCSGQQIACYFLSAAHVDLTYSIGSSSCRYCYF